MIWIAFALLAVGTAATGIAFAYRFGQWIIIVQGYRDATNAGIARLADNTELIEKRISHVDSPTKPDPLPPLPACSCGSLDLLTLTGSRTRIVCCQRCGLVFGVDAAGVRFVRHPEAIPEYATQRAARTLAYEEMKHAMDAKRPEKMRAREPMPRPSP